MHRKLLKKISHHLDRLEEMDKRLYNLFEDRLRRMLREMEEVEAR